MITREYQRYLHSPEWAAKKAAVIARAGGQCETELTAHGALAGYRCHRKGLQVHHLTYVRVGKEDLEDLMLVCACCHERARSKWIKPHWWRKKIGRVTA